MGWWEHPDNIMPLRGQRRILSKWRAARSRKVLPNWRSLYKSWLYRGEFSFAGFRYQSLSFRKRSEPQRHADGRRVTQPVSEDSMAGVVFDVFEKQRYLPAASNSSHFESPIDFFSYAYEVSAIRQSMDELPKIPGFAGLWP